MQQAMPAPANRLGFVEGLKGISALQVIALHYISAFFPVMARFDGVTRYGFESWIAASPLFILYNGFAAYNLFFLMSGFVLAPSTARITDGWFNQAARRLFRLFLPTAAAFFMAVALLMIFPDAKQQANQIAQSGWLAGSENSPMTFPALSKDLFLNSMILGYGEKSLWASFNFMHPYLTTWAQSVNGPFWTLHIILWGSFLVLLLAWLRQHLPTRIFFAATAGIFLVTGTGGFSLFLIGYLMYDLYQFLQRRPMRGLGIVGILSLLIGLALIDSQNFHALEPIFNLQNSIRPGPTLYTEWIDELGAVFIFFGVMTLAPVVKFLSAPVFLSLGRVSFSLFLVHFPILFTVSCLLFSHVAQYGYLTGFLITAAVGISLSLIVAYAFEHVVEKPSMNLTKRLFSPERAATTVVT